ncbi:MAG TPA: PIG-L family deacetylase [Nitrososphaera sp.]|jgi:LmbE family N-acetylglucosaminyl deacetylase|nr:PIG-L family deacetylase [Nitrososphaera sp.]
MMNILAIGAHPDDVELGCGGLLLKASRQGHHNIFMYTLTRGGASGDPEERTKELMQSAKFIGAKRLWIDNFDDTKLSLSSDLINHIEFFIKKADPDIVLTHSLGDTHHDHRAIAASTMEAGRFVPNILAYEIPVTRDFNPQVYYDISDVIDDKIRLINIFWSQRSKMFLKSNAIRGLAEYRALQSRFNNTVTCVEAFEVQKLFFGKEFKLLKIPQESIPKLASQQMPKEVIESITT